MLLNTLRPALVATTLALLLLQTGCAGEGQGGGRPPDQEFADLQDVQDFIFTPTCAIAGCHNAVTQAGGLALDSVAVSHARLVDIVSFCGGLVRVTPFDANASYFLNKLGRGDEPCAAVMPLGAPLLSEDDLDFIASWIEGGALEAGETPAARRRRYAIRLPVTPASTTTTSTLIDTW